MYSINSHTDERLRVPLACRAATLILVFAVLLCGATSDGLAQNRLGFYIGPNLATLKSTPDADDGTTSRRTGLSIGTFYDAAAGRKVAIQFRGGYVEKGNDFRFADLPATGEFELKYIETAVLLKVMFSDGPIQPYVMAGPSISYLTEARYTVSGEFRGEKFEESLDISEYLNDTELGFELGFGIQSRHLFVELEYKLGLTNILKDSDGEELNNRGFQIVIGLSIPVD